MKGATPTTEPDGRRVFIACVDAMGLPFAKAHLDRLPVVRSIIEHGALVAARADDVIDVQEPAGEGTGGNGTTTRGGGGTVRLDVLGPRRTATRASSPAPPSCAPCSSHSAPSRIASRRSGAGSYRTSFIATANASGTSEARGRPRARQPVCPAASPTTFDARACAISSARGSRGRSPCR